MDTIIKHYGFLKSIINNQGSVFTSKFWFLICYFFGIKQKLSIIYYLQTKSQIERYNDTIEIHPHIFTNWDEKTEKSSYPWRNLCITSPKMKTLIIHLSNSTMAIIFTCFLRIKLMLTQDLTPSMNWQKYR